jgi:hypothetical protein
MTNSAYFMSADATSDRIPDQALDPWNGFGRLSAANRRTVNGEIVAEAGTTHRGEKNILWSSEGWTLASGIVVPALSAAQKRANGTHSTNVGGTTALDTRNYRALLLLVSLTAISGGSSPSIAYAVNFLDDSISPTAFPAWAPTALTAGANVLNAIGGGDSATGSVAIPVGPQSQFAWTVTGSPTTCTWTAWVYGIN